MDYQVVIEKAQLIINTAIQARSLNDIKEAIDPTEGGNVIPLDNAGNPIDYQFFNDDADLQAIITAQQTAIDGQVTALEVIIGGLADNIKAEV
jgi:hypothetical protein